VRALRGHRESPGRLSLPSTPLFPSIGGSGQGCPRLRATFSPSQTPIAPRRALVPGEHRFIARVLQARRAPGRFPFSSPSFCTSSVSSRQGTHVAPIAAVERGPSQGARSGSTGATWVSCHSAPFLSPHLALEEGLGLPQTARVQRGPSQAARCASTGGCQATIASHSPPPVQYLFLRLTPWLS